MSMSLAYLQIKSYFIKFIDINVLFIYLFIINSLMFINLFTFL